MSRFDDFRCATPLRRLNKFVQILLALCLIAGLNTLATRHYLREDISRQGAFSLSPETMAYLRSLKEPVQVIVTRGAAQRRSSRFSAVTWAESSPSTAKPPGRAGAK
jgi:hypothetical protein